MILPLALAQFIASYAATNMNVAITPIATDLGTTVAGVQTAITLFTLTMAALMIPGSKLTDIWGRKRCFVIGLAVYAIGGLLAALSQGLPQLIIGYSLLEGVGSALMIPPIYILVTVTFPDVKSRARYFGVVSGAGGLGAAAGPLIGGLITSAISWRASFGLQVLVVAWIFLHVRSSEKKGKDVLLPLRLFRNKVASLGLGTQTIQWLILQGSFFAVSVYLQEVNHYSPIQTGLMLTPATIGILAASGRRGPVRPAAPAAVADHRRVPDHRGRHDLAAGPGPGARGHLAVDTRAAAVRRRGRDHADLLGQRGPVQLPCPRHRTRPSALGSLLPCPALTRQGASQRATLSRVGSAVTLEVPRPGRRCLWERCRRYP